MIRQVFYYTCWRLNLGTNLRQFNKELNKAADFIQGDMAKWYRKVIFEVFKRIVLRTPVDTGRARGNWQLEAGRSASGTVEIEGNEGEMADHAMRNAETILATIPAFSLVHITNNVEYVYYLEYDKRSSQHPEGMVEITLTEMASWLANIGISHRG